MTDGKADYWDSFFTKNPPVVDPAKKGGYFTRQRELLNMLDKAAAGYILTNAETAHKSPVQTIGEMVYREISQSA